MNVLRQANEKTPGKSSCSTGKGVPAWVPPPWLIPLIEKANRKKPSRDLPEHPEEQPELEISDDRQLPEAPDRPGGEGPRGVAIIDTGNVIPEGSPRKRPKNNP